MTLWLVAVTPRRLATPHKLANLITLRDTDRPSQTSDRCPPDLVFPYLWQRSYRSDEIFGKDRGPIGQAGWPRAPAPQRYLLFERRADEGADLLSDLLAQFIRRLVEPGR